MIYTALYELEKTPVLSSDQAIKIKSYINNKYHYFTNAEAATIFADAVHKILDNELKIFSKTERQTIKKDILANAVYRDQFFLTGYDVFKGIIHVERSEGDFLVLVKEWLRTHFDYTKSTSFVREIENYINGFEDNKSYTVKNNSYVDKKDYGTAKVVKSVINDQILETAVPSNCIEADMVTRRNDKTLISDILSSSYGYALEKVCDSYNILLENSRSAINQGEKLLNQTKSIVLDNEWREALWDRVANPVKASIVALGILVAIQTSNYVDSNIHAIRSSGLNSTTQLTYESGYAIASNDTMIPLLPEKLYTKLKDSSEIVGENLNKTTTKNESVKQNSNDFVEFSYRSIDAESLKNYLKKRNSKLAEEPYFSTMLSTAMEYDINPIILFAITGQEQGFVSNKSSDAAKIANNPFNVYGSWKKYNTNIQDSSKIASVTLLRLYEGCPDGTDPIKWINRKYAEDKNWHKGVNSIIEEIESKVCYNN